MLAVYIGSILTLITLNYLKLCSPVPLEITAHQCMPNKTICANNICTVTKTRRGINLINFYCFLKEPVTSLLVKLKFFRKNRNVYRKFMFDIEEDACRLLDGTSYSSVLAGLIPAIKKYADFIHPCPFIGNLTVSEYPADLSFLPFAIPRGEYRLIGSATNLNGTILYLNATVFLKIS